MKEYHIGQQVSFPDALGYGISTLLNWIAYLIIVCILDAIMFAIVISAMEISAQSENVGAMIFSLILALIAGFIMFVLTSSLFIAITYKSIADIGMKAASTIEVESAAFPTLSDSPSSIFSEEPKVNQTEIEMIKIECPNCNKIFSVKKLGQLQEIKCKFCGQKGEIEI